VLLKGRKINIFIKLHAKQEGVEEKSENEFIVRINVPPVEGKANKRAGELLADFFQIPKGKIHLLKGEKSKKKVFLIEGDT
jgi:uncharacterized protein